MQAVATAVQPPISSAETEAAPKILMPLESEDREETSDGETYDIEARFLSLLSSFDIKQPVSESAEQILGAENDNRGYTESPSPKTKPSMVESMSRIRDTSVIELSEYQEQKPHQSHKTTEGASPTREDVTSNILTLTKTNAIGAHEVPDQDSSQRPTLSAYTTTESTKVTNYETLLAQQTRTSPDDSRPIVPIQKPETIHNDLSQGTPLTIAPQQGGGDSAIASSLSARSSSISPALMLNQVVSHLRENLTQGSPQQTFTLTLIPAELGQITINASFEGASLSLAFQGLPATLDLLKVHQELLLQNLSTQGIAVNQSNLSFNHNTSGERDEHRPDAAQDPPPVSFKKLRESLHRLKQGLFA